MTRTLGQEDPIARLRNRILTDIEALAELLYEADHDPDCAWRCIELDCDAWHSCESPDHDED